MKIAILGTRGIPANYGGFETFAEELSTRLSERGHDVAVFCRSHYLPRGTSGMYRGVRLIALPTIRSKHLDTVVHSLLSAFYAMARPFDAVLICNAANSFCCALLALRGTPTVLNVDGIERERRKWGLAGRLYYRCSEKMAVAWASRLVSDAEVIRTYYRQEHGADSTCIPYGFAAPASDSGVLQEYGLRPRGYYLYVSRLEPENNAHVVIRAHTSVGSAMPLVVVGSAPYARRYIASLRDIAGPGVLFCGAIYGARYHGLQANAFAYIQATEVGGTHPALVEAMGHGNLIVANDTPENREVLGEAGIYYARNDPRQLAERLRQCEREPDLRGRLGGQAQERARRHYDWETITAQYEALFDSLTAGKSAE